jgi:hypothetical protein
MTLLQILQSLFVEFDCALQLLDILCPTLAECSLGLPISLLSFFGSRVYRLTPTFSFLLLLLLGVVWEVLFVGAVFMLGRGGKGAGTRPVTSSLGIFHLAHGWRIHVRRSGNISHLQVPTPPVPLLEAEMADAKTVNGRGNTLTASDLQRIEARLVNRSSLPGRIR